MDDDLDATYAPRSPDLSNDFYEPEPLPFAPQGHIYRGSVSHTLTPFTPTERRNPFASGGAGSPFSAQPNPFSAPSQGSYFPSQQTPHGQHLACKQGFSFPVKRESNGAQLDDDDDPMAPNTRKKVKAEVKNEDADYGNGTGSAGGAVGGAEVRTKFPVARIKRIMQSDEDVGKVAQVTPVVVSKALELFMIDLVTAAATEAKSRSSKRVTAAHLKQAVMSNEKHRDWLGEIVSKAPDAPAAGTASGKAAKDEDSDDWVNEGAPAAKKKKSVGRRRKPKAED